MELPGDVLSIIRDYSKPVFVWYKEARALSLCSHHVQKLKEKMDDPIVIEQLKICVEACADHAFLHRDNPLNEERESKKDWWTCVSMDKLYDLLDDTEHRGMNYAEWLFHDDMDDAWMDSDEDTVES